MFFSQYFSFPLSVSFHHCTILIHPFTTQAVKCFSPTTSVFPCQYHSTIAPYSFVRLPPTLYNVFFPSTSLFPCQYHSTIAPYSTIHLPLTLYNFFLSVIHFSPVSIIPPLLHIHSSVSHPHCIMFFSQYISFPLSVSFQHCSIIIHPSTTHAV